MADYMLGNQILLLLVLHVVHGLELLLVLHVIHGLELLLVLHVIHGLVLLLATPLLSQGKAEKSGIKAARTCDCRPLAYACTAADAACTATALLLLLEFLLVLLLLVIRW